MDNSSTEYTVLDGILSDEDLDNFIQTTQNVNALKSLLQVKHRRILEGKCEKLNFSIDSIFAQENINIDLKTEVLITALHVVADVDFYLLQIVKRFINDLHTNQNENELYNTLHLFNAVINFCKDEGKADLLFEVNNTHVHDAILTLIKNSSKHVTLFTIMHFLPNYVNISNKYVKNILLKNLFTLINKELKNLEIVCLLHDHFISGEVDDDSFNLIKLNDYYLLLSECITSSNNYLQKQSSYLLSKSVEISLQCNNLSFVSPFLKVNSSINDAEKVWKDYFTLLDVSNEKQLHIIEPSLGLLNSVKYLHPIWRTCLYQIYLNHSQNAVVFNVIMYMLKNESDWITFSALIDNLLCSVNKNEYVINYRKTFEEIGRFSKALTQNRFENFIEKSLNVAWSPSVCWCFYSEIFNDNFKFSIPINLLKDLIKKLYYTPHIYIRNGCIKAVLYCFVNNFVFTSFDDFLKISYTLQNCDEAIFNIFIINNKEKVLLYADNLHDRLLQSFKDDEYVWKYVEVYAKIIKVLEVPIYKIPHFEKPNYCTDLIQLIFFDNLSPDDIEMYMEKRIHSMEEREDFSNLLLLVQKLCTPKILKIAFDILLEEDINKYSNIQKWIAFKIIYNSNNFELVINSWKNKSFLFTGKNCEYITEAFVELYYKYLNDNSISDQVVAEAAAFLENILDRQSKAVVVIYKNIFVFLRHADNSTILKFIDRCFDEFLKFNKKGQCNKETVVLFLDQIYQINTLENETLYNKIPIFTQKLLEISNTDSTVLQTLAKKIVHLSQQNAVKSTIFIPTIVEFILHGLIINKTERVEYSVCQEIGRRLQILENNPNLEGISIRLWALEAMLNLVKGQPPETDEITTEFVSLLIEKYMKYFGKRYFPNSQIHLQKLRIIQALLLIHGYKKTKKENIVNILKQSFITESHQPSIKHLMQWLLINLLKRNGSSSIKFIEDQLKTVNIARPSTVSGFIPVLYHLTLFQDEDYWDRIVSILLPCTMGPQFKLRIYAQVALVKLYEKAQEMKYDNFINRYKVLYNSLSQVIEASGNTLHDVVTVNKEFLEYFSLENCDCTSIYYLIPKLNGVSVTEWENLNSCQINPELKHLNFDIPVDADTDSNECCSSKNFSTEFNENIQRKITPWKDMLADTQYADRKDNFILVTSLIEKPANLGGLSRTCEVFGIKKLIMKTSKIVTDKEFKSLSMSSESRVDITEVKVEDLQQFIIGIKNKGYSVVGAEQTSESVKLDEFKFPKMTVLLLGNEKEGIPPNLIPLLDSCIEIPQFGVVRSLNVHVAGAIVIWEYCKQHRL